MKIKTFDCVKMKEECQRACEKRYAGLSFEERQKKMEEDILADPILGNFFRKTFKPDGLDAAYKPATFVAEAGAGYGAEKQAK
ncbi:MAG TPA: hypothetical protein P5204_07875 [Kiritimatiellia bacterium]|nr:hypothetical protein [Kiritimatiellia bacterium]